MANMDMESASLVDDHSCIAIFLWVVKIFNQALQNKRDLLLPREVMELGFVECIGSV